MEQLKNIIQIRDREFNLMTKSEIKQKLDELYEDAHSKLKEFITHSVRGVDNVMELNMESGEIERAVYTNNYTMYPTNIPIYSLDNYFDEDDINIILGSEEEFDEFARLEEEEQITIGEYCSRKGIDKYEAITDYLIDSFQEAIVRLDIDEEIEKLYGTFYDEETGELCIQKLKGGVFN